MFHCNNIGGPPIQPPAYTLANNSVVVGGGMPHAANAAASLGGQHDGVGGSFMRGGPVISAPPQISTPAIAGVSAAIGNAVDADEDPANALPPTRFHVTVFVGNISEHANNNFIRNLLSVCGPMKNWKRVAGATGKLQAFGFCEYTTADSAARAIRLLHDRPQAAGKRLVVKVDSKTKSVLEEFYESKRDQAEAAGGGDSGHTAQVSDDGSLYNIDMATRLLDEAALTHIENLTQAHLFETADAVAAEEAKAATVSPAVSTTALAPVPPVATISKTVNSGPFYNNDPQVDQLKDYVEEEKRDMIHREINKFRESIKASNCTADGPPGDDDADSVEADVTAGKGETAMIESNSISSPERRRRVKRTSVSPDSRKRSRSKSLASPTGGISHRGRERSGSRRRKSRSRDVDRRSRSRRRDSTDDLAIVEDVGGGRGRQRSELRKRSRSRSPRRRASPPPPPRRSSPPRSRSPRRSPPSFALSSRERERLEEEREAKRNERIAKENEASYQDRLAKWEAREARKAEERIAQAQRDTRRIRDGEKTRTARRQLAAEYKDDCENDSEANDEDVVLRADGSVDKDAVKRRLRRRKDWAKWFVGRDMEKRLAERQREIEADDDDRLREKAEFRTLRQQLMDQGVTDVDSELERRIAMEERMRAMRLQSQFASRQAKMQQQAKRQTVSIDEYRCRRQRRGSGASSTSSGSSSVDPLTEANGSAEVITLVDFDSVSVEHHATLNPITDLVDEDAQENDQDEDVVVTGQSQNVNHSDASSAAAVPRIIIPPRVSMAPMPADDKEGGVDDSTALDRDARQANDDGPVPPKAQFQIKVAATAVIKGDVLPGVFTAVETEEKAARKLPTPPPLSAEERRRQIKRLIEQIPTEKSALFAYPIDWQLVDADLMTKRIQPWVAKKIAEYIGEPEPTLAEFICSKITAKSEPQAILDDVQMVLDEEADVFVIKMWRLLIYELLNKRHKQQQHMTSMALILALAMLAAVTTGCTGSPGDRSFVFRRCVDSCWRANCTTADFVPRDSSPTWPHPTCKSECDHECAWTAIKAFRAAGLPEPQFYGKWTFRRIAGVQEPMSTLFSLLNLATSGVALRRVAAASTSTTKSLRRLWCVAFVTLCVAWTASAAFHTTEALDYIAAYLTVSSLSLSFFSRQVALRTTRLAWYAAALFVTATGVIYHLVDIWRTINTSAASRRSQFDYGHNMRVNVATAAVGIGAWLIWSFTAITNVNSKKLALDAVKSLRVALATIVCGSLFELLDFPPVFDHLVDAHSLWHLSTVTFPLKLATFAVADVNMVFSQTHADKFDRQKQL